MTDIRRATAVLDAMAEGVRPLTLAELAARTRLPRSTVHRVIQALEREMYVIRGSPYSGYSLGPGLLKFGMTAHLQLLAANRHQLVALARAVNENVELAVFSGREAVVADQIASSERLRAVTKVGKSFSLHASSIGKALLAQLADDQIEELLAARLPRFTANTITDRTDLMADVGTIRRSRVAVDVEEHDQGVCSVATGMIGLTGALQAVSVVVPTRRFAAKADLAVDCLRQMNPRVNPSLAREQYAAR